MLEAFASSFTHLFRFASTQNAKGTSKPEEYEETHKEVARLESTTNDMLLDELLDALEAKAVCSEALEVPASCRVWTSRQGRSFFKYILSPNRRSPLRSLNIIKQCMLVFKV